MPRVTITITDKQAQPYRFPLDRDNITIGRGRENDICISSESVSVQHAKMKRVPGGYELRDMGSTNGIKFEGEKKIFVILLSEMTVRVGEADFHFQLSEEEKEALKAEMPAVESPEKTKKQKAEKEDWDDEDDDDDDDDDDDEEEEEEKKREKKKKKKKARDDGSSSQKANPEKRPDFAPRRLPSSSGISGGAIVFFLLLAAALFFVGMSIRFHNETGGSLLQSVLSHFKNKEAPAKEAPAKEPAPNE